MKKILLLRHAKSDREHHMGPDFDRYLNDRGRADAPKVAAALSAKGLIPQLFVASPAVRVRETLDLMYGVWDSHPELVWEKSLYLCSSSTVLDLMEQQDELLDFVGFAGHNPCMEEVYTALTGSRTVMFPTCAAAVLSFNCESWLSVPETPADVVLFLTPREL
jgi:phosphohistidine phosphatase